MKTSKISENANRVANTQTSAQAQESGHTRVLETRDRWSAIFSHAVGLVVILSKGEELPTNPQQGFGWGKVADEPHSRTYAKSLIAGFLTGKAGKVFAKNEFLANKTNREKIASRILLSTKLVKPSPKQSQQDAVNGTLAKTEPKQAKSFAEAVLNALTQQTEPTTPKGGRGKSQPKKAEKPTTKGGNKKKTSQPKKAEKPTTKGGKKSETKDVTKGYNLSSEEKKYAKHHWKWRLNADETEDDGTILDCMDDIAVELGFEDFESPQYQAVEEYVNELDRAYSAKHGFAVPLK